MEKTTVTAPYCIRGELDLPVNNLLAAELLFFGAMESGIHLKGAWLPGESLASLVSNLESWGYAISSDNEGIKLLSPEKKDLPRELSVSDPIHIPMYIGFFITELTEFQIINTGFYEVSLNFINHLDKMGIQLKMESFGKEKKYKVSRGAVFNRLNLIEGLNSSERSGLLLANRKAVGKGMVTCPEVGPSTLERMWEWGGVLFSSKSHLESSESELEKRLRKASLSQEKSVKKIKNLHWQSHDPLKVHLDLPGESCLALPFVLAASLLPNSCLKVQGLTAAPEHLITFQLLRRMGCEFRWGKKIENQGLPLIDLTIETGVLEGRTMDYSKYPDLVWEAVFPILAGSFAQGKTIIKGLSSLRTKEKDWLQLILNTLKNGGVHIGLLEDGMVIKGAESYQPFGLDAKKNPWLTMMYSVFSIINSRKIEVENPHGLEDIFPSFNKCLGSLVQDT